MVLSTNQIEKYNISKLIRQTQKCYHIVNLYTGVDCRFKKICCSAIRKSEIYGDYLLNRMQKNGVTINKILEKISLKVNLFLKGVLRQSTITAVLIR